MFVDRSSSSSTKQILNLNDCFALCERIARASNFYRGLKLLPKKKRRAMAAVYAFLRHCDDISDNNTTITQKQEQFVQTRSLLNIAFQHGETDSPVVCALLDTVRTFEIPIEYFHQVMEGTEMDLVTTRYQTFEDLYRYCYLVASVVGLICIQIFGFEEVQAKECAVACGIAFQLTNIMRDVSEDLERDRIYLPLADLSHFNYAPEDIRRRVVDDRFRSLMAYEAQRAKKYYAEARPLLNLLHRDSRPSFWAMLESYQTILQHIEKSGYAVLLKRVKLNRRDKCRIAFQSLLHW